jgi:hypothetical protein
LAFLLRGRRTTRSVVLSWTMTAATSRVIDPSAGLRAFGWSLGLLGHGVPFGGRFVGQVGRRLRGRGVR